MSLRLLNAFGPVQVLGERATGRRRFGVPVGGAFDQESLQLANVLAGSPPDHPCWELSMAQARFHATVDGTVGVAGGAAAVRLPSGSTEASAVFAVRKGDEFLIESPSEGARVYAAYGPIRHPYPWVRKAEEGPSSVRFRHEIRVMPGPDERLIGLEQLLTTFTVSRNSNRVGIRLEPGIAAHTYELTSTPQCVGIVQVSNDGTLILLGPDGPTIGGYPMVGAVCSADIDRMAQLRPGDNVTFRPVTVAESQKLIAEEAVAREVRLNLLRLALSF